MNNQTVKIFKDVFENTLHLLNNPICSECDAQLKHPLLPWIVGSNYQESKEKILFVGKPHRGTPGEYFPSGLLDPREPHLEWLMECSWSYWSYTREILKKLYATNQWDYCAFTNIIKCTNVYGSGQDSTLDKTSYNMAKSCILELGVIFKEIEILEPNHIIFYTYNLHKEMLVNIPFAESIYEKTPIEHKISCGQKKLGWWERNITTSWNDKVKLLVVGHPERMKKDEYISLIVDWVTS